MTKIQVGDKIWVEFNVESIGDGSISLNRGGLGYNRHVITMLSDFIVKHIPKPPEPLRVRDQVQYKPGLSPQTEPGQGTILAFFEDRAWVAFGNLSVPLSPLIDSLERIK